MNSNSKHWEVKAMDQESEQKKSTIFDFVKDAQVFLLPEVVEEIEPQLLKSTYQEVYNDLKTLDALNTALVSDNYTRLYDLFTICQKFLSKDFSLQEALTDHCCLLFRKLRLLFCTETLSWICDVIERRILNKLSIVDSLERLLASIEMLNSSLFDNANYAALDSMLLLVEENFHSESEYQSEEASYFALFTKCMRLARLLKESNMELEAESLFNLMELVTFDLVTADIRTQKIFGSRLLSYMLSQCDATYHESLTEFYLDIFQKEQFSEEAFSLVVRTIFTMCKTMSVRVKVLDALRERNSTHSLRDFFGMLDTDFFECYVESEDVDESKISQQLAKKYLDEILLISEPLAEQLRSFLSIYIMPRFESILDELSNNSSVEKFHKHQQEITQLVQITSVWQLSR